ncbi:DUF3772 domain-containing protein [Psychromarinibacter halotolerans]|uniref:DUF3772 domain-containing protein n=1 Tax=Psychromarinibacter halotolerans TaxID=1775175 RepID=A0ABV7GXQ1_9RHOB|nr:DUF3772 domain-containing protein [Psychromarinibacter halotolerans]MDF0597537.1 DUF3772 domain-containing protein [Psychromarinibacter halotolerans]
MTFLPRLLLILALALGTLAPVEWRPGWIPGSGPAAAQQAIDYDAWHDVALRAEAALDSGEASTEALEDLRAEVVGWRQRFLEAQDTNAAAIESLRDQLDALGPAPEEGETEADEIAARRAELTEDLANAEVPGRTAEAAFRRAEAIVRQIDTLVRTRQAGELMQIGPSPAIPALWPDALADFAESFREMAIETRAQWNSDITRETFRTQLPFTVVYIVIAAVLLLRGRRAMVWLTQAVLNRSRGRARWLAGFITSLFQVVVPVLGILLLLAALISTGLFGVRGTTFISALSGLGMATFIAWWIGLRLYPLHEDAPRPLAATFEYAGEMRFHAILLGVLVGLRYILSALVGVDSYSEGTRAVLYFPLLVAFGFVFLRIGRILMRSVSLSEANDELDVTFAQRGQRLVGQALVVLAVVGPALALVGYLNAAIFAMVPTVSSLAVLALLRILHDIVVELYGLITRKSSEEAGQALTPSLISFGLVIASLPVFALIWGARPSDLLEVWAQFNAGFSVGDAQISPSVFLTFLLVFVVLFAGTRLFQSALKSTILPKTGIDPGGQNAIVSGIGYLGIGLGAVIAITTAGIDLSALAFVAGALSVGIGFGMQNIVSNFISGLILLVERPVAEGDWIEVGGHMGIVKDISVRSTRIETFDKNDVIVPNADFISGAVKNWTRGSSVGRIIVTVGVAYGTDTRKVEKILLEIAMNHPLVALDPEPEVDFLEFGASSLDFQMRMVLRDIAYGLPVRTEIRHQIAERFAAEGIEIPFAQQDIWIRNPEAMRLGKAQVATEEAAPEPPTDDAAASSSGSTSDMRGEDTVDDAGPDGDQA